MMEDEVMMEDEGGQEGQLYSILRSDLSNKGVAGCRWMNWK